MDSFESLLNAANLMKMNLEEAILKLLYQNYRKPFLLESRIKSVDKIKLKYKLQIKKGLSGNANGLVPDIIEFRISVDSEDEVDFSDEIPFEIQIMTEQMRDWTNKTHLEYDEEKYKGL